MEIVSPQGLATAPIQPMMTTYPSMPAPLLQALEWLLATPSIPIVLRKQFFVLWESVIFGNYDEKDRKFLGSKFREWEIELMWYIPEQKWGNILDYKDEDKDAISLQMDLNMLLNMLEELFYINLTRGKDGFTVKELNTNRNRSIVEGMPLSPEQQMAGKGRPVIRLF